VFLVWHPTKYAEMLGRLIDQHGCRVWLVNTGWSGGAYGVGKRMKIAYTRSMVHAILDGALDDAATRQDSVFGLSVPCAVPNVPATVLDPRSTWLDPAAYDVQAHKLAAMFRANIEKFGPVAQLLRSAGPKG